jgi:hypothetical protein
MCWLSASLYRTAPRSACYCFSSMQTLLRAWMSQIPKKPPKALVLCCMQVRSDLEDVVVALDLARATFRRIQANYGWALIYNVLMVPVAAGVLYPSARVRLPPVLAGLAMAFSSVSVVCSSLLLNRYRRPPPVLRDFSWQERARLG